MYDVVFSDLWLVTDHADDDVRIIGASLGIRIPRHHSNIIFTDDFYYYDI